LIQALSRFSETPSDLLIELTPEGYKTLGAPGDAAKAQVAADFLSVIPKSKRKAKTIEDLVNETEASRAQVQHLLDALMEAGEVARTGKGRKGSPYRYFRP
jgi:predicted Rossmann fold nucleotide-binding protein DprA/Smf involved in DNA uptake